MPKDIPLTWKTKLKKFPGPDLDEILHLPTTEYEKINEKLLFQPNR